MCIAQSKMSMENESIEEKHVHIYKRNIDAKFGIKVIYSVQHTFIWIF